MNKYRAHRLWLLALVFGVVGCGATPELFVVYGDCRSNDTHRRIVEQVAAENPEFVIQTGDMVSNGGDVAQWDDFRDIIAGLGDIEFFPVIGNHDDDETGDVTNYLNVFDLPTESSGTERYYSLRRGNALFVFLDSNLPLADGAPQKDWLRDQLSGNFPKHVYVVFHHPPYGVKPNRWNNDELIAQVHQLFVESGVEIVFNGHDHYYYRTNRDGVTYVVTGGGGAALYDIDPQAPLPDDVYGKFYHHLVVTLEGNETTVRAIDLEGTVRDEFRVSVRR